MDDINMNDELVERQAAYNLHFLPLPGRANDRETQMARLQDYMIADRDEDAAKRVRDYYGEAVPVGAVSEKAMQYFVGAAMARNLGISGAPEAYWLGREKPEALPEVEQQDDLYTEMGRDLITKTQDAWVEQQVKLQERRQTLGTVLQQIVQEGEANKKESAAWLGFLDAQGRGVWSEDEAVSLVKATEAFSMMRGLMDDPQSAGANVLTKGSTGQLIFDALYGDEMATGLFFGALQDRIADMKTAEEERNALVQFAHAFESATKNLTAGMMGGHFRAFVTDEQVEEFNANRSRHEAFQAVLQGAAGADYEAAGGLSVMEDMSLQEIAHAARESGQLNADGSLRKMTDEERRSTQELNEFRGQLHNAVQGVYDIDGLAKLGKMMPGSLAYLVPGGMLASAMSMRTHDLASQLGEGSDWVSANARATVNAAIQAGVEKMAFGSIKATKMAPGLDALMSTGPMARVFGKLYGTTAGRIGMGVVAGGLEETFAEPAAGLLLSGIYNAFAPTGLELDSPWVEYKNEMAEMLKPDQILATALYGLLLGGVNVPGHRAEAKHYKKVVEGLERIGIDHNVAANMARSDGSLQQIAAGVQQVDAALKKDAGGVFGYIAELYPQLQEISTFENLMRSYNLPKMLPGEGGNVRVQYKDEDGKVQELVMSQEAGRLFVQARIEQLGSKVQVGFADMVLGQVMTGKVAEKSDSWVVSVEDADMNADYFRRIAAAAGIRLSQGAKATDIDPEIHPYIPLGTLAQQGRAWESRMRVARGEVEEKLGRKLTDEEWTQREQQLVSRVNRVRVASQDGRVRTVLRVARGGYGAMEVLEDVTEDFFSLDMEENGRELGWYADNLLELERALGRQGAFLHALKEGESYDRMAIIEGVGKLVQSKVLADTTKKYKLSEKLNAFLDMIRHLVQRAVAMLKLGKAINKVLADKEASAKLDPEFVGMVDRLVEKDVEFLRELQLEDGLAAMQRVLEQRVPSTPVLAEAEAKHGAEVREEMAAKAAAQRKVDADVAEGEAAVDGDFSSSVVNQEELDAIKAAAEKDGTFMKAPNGEPTRLTEQQWLQVRTEAFKAWFGDWEYIAWFKNAYNKIMSIPEVAQITGREFRKDVTPESMEEYWNAVCGGAVENPQVGRIELNRRSFKSSINHGAYRMKFAAFAQVHKVLEKGIVFAEEKNWKERGYDTCCIAAPLRVNDSVYICQAVVKKHPGKNAFYLHEVELKENLPTEGRTGFYTGSHSGGDKGLLAQYTEKVNTIWENCSKVVDENGEPLVVYHGTARSKPISIFKSGKSGYLGPGIYFTPEKRTASKYTGMYGDGLVYEGFVNMRNPLAISYADKPAKVILDAVKEGVYEKRIETQGNESQLLKKTDLTKLRKKGYDGIVWAPMKALDEGSFESGEMLLFESNQIKSATDNRGTFDGSEADISMSMEHNLAAVHTLSPEKFLSALELGGMPMPSVAVTRLDKPYGWGGAGNIMLVGRPALVDPKEGTEVYSRDAWTGNFPRVEHKVIGKKDRSDSVTDLHQLKQKYQEKGDYNSSIHQLDYRINMGYGGEQTGRSDMDYALRQRTGKALFAWQSGYQPRPKMKDAERVHEWLTKEVANRLRRYVSLSPDEYHEKWPEIKEEVRQEIEKVYRESSVIKNAPTQEAAEKRLSSWVNVALRAFDAYSPSALAKELEDVKKIDARVLDVEANLDMLAKYADKHKKAYEAWIEEKLNAWFSKESYIHGTKKEATLDNLAEYMLGIKARGEEKGLAFSSGRVRAYQAERLYSLQDIKERRESLTDSEASDEMKAQTNEWMSEWREGVAAILARGGVGSGFTVRDDAMETLSKVKGTPTADKVRAAVRKMFRGASNLQALLNDAEVINAGVEALKSLHAELEDYMEAVPQRAVRMNEWEYAVMPESLKKNKAVMAGLRENGIRPRFHDGTEDGRKAALAGLVNDARVSFSVVGPSAANWDKIKHRAFKGRDDGKLRVELDASQAMFRSPSYRERVDEIKAFIEEQRELAVKDGRQRQHAELEARLDRLDEAMDSASEDEVSEILREYERIENERKDFRRKLYGEWRAVFPEIEMEEGDYLLLERAILGEKGASRTNNAVFMLASMRDNLGITPVERALHPKLEADRESIVAALKRLKESEVAQELKAVYDRTEAGERTEEMRARVEQLADDVRQEAVRLGVPERILRGKPWFRVHMELFERDAEDVADAALRTVLLEDVLDFPELYEAYPQLRDYRVYGDMLGSTAYRGMYDGWNAIVLNDMLGEQEVLGTLLHEVQHAIQKIEGFARGGNEDYANEEALLLASVYPEKYGWMLEKSPYELYRRLAGEVEARNVQKRVGYSAVEREMLPFNSTMDVPAYETLVSFSVFSPSEASGLRALQSAVRGKQDAVFRSDTLNADVMLPFGSAGVYKNPDNPKSKIVGAHGLLHIITARMAHGDSLEEATYTAVKAVLAAVNGRIVGDSSSENKKELTLDGYNTWVYLKWRAENKAWVVTGYKENDKHSSVDDRQRAMNLAESYALNTFGGLERVGAALEYSIARVAREYKQNNANPFLKLDFSSSMVDLSEEGIAHDIAAAGYGFRANREFAEQMMREIRASLVRMKKLGSKTRTDREDALAAMGGITHMVRALVQYLPRGYRFAVHPYMSRLEVLTELATTGNVEMLRENVSKGLQAWMDETSETWHEVLPQLSGNENMTREELTARVQEMMKEHAGQQLTEAVERIVERVAGQLRKHAKDTAVKRMRELLERVMPKKDPKSGKLKGGKMSADDYRDLEDVQAALDMNAEKLEAKMAALKAEMETPGLSEEKRDEKEALLMLYDQFGDPDSMSAEEAVAAYEALRQRIWMSRFEWENIQSEKRAARRAVVRRIVEGVGSVSENEYNAKKRRVKPTKRMKNLGDVLAGMPAAVGALRGYLPLREMADSLTRRANRAGELIKEWEAERWIALEALSKQTLGKSWRLSMDYMHKVLPTGVAFERPVYRTVDIKVPALRELLQMDAKARVAEMKRRREAGGKEAETALSERDIEAAAKELERMDEAGEVKGWVHTRYLKELRREENLQLSRGEALYAILMYEQPTYTERMEAQGYTPEVVAGLKKFIGDGMLEFGYGLRELFRIQGDKIAAIYEREFGVPFPREENYFAARWDVTEMKENPAEQLLAGMAGTPGAGNGWMKTRVNHELELDMTKDALQVFLQATTLTDTWMATQDIVADFKAWTRDKDFARALTALLGEESYTNLKDWIRILEQGGAQDCLNMGVTQDVINGLYGSGAVAILGLRVQTLIRQLPSVFNGMLGASDITAGEWFATLARMKHGDAPMTFKRMKDSVLMKNRQQGRAGNMASQAVRSGDTDSSVTEEFLLASMLPMEWMDASCTAMSLVPVWNVYYDRAVRKGANHQEAEQAAWEQTTVVANLASQPIGWLNKSKIAQSRNPIVKSMFYMLSENTAKFALCRALWKGRNKKAAVRAWLVYGAANAAISALLDCLQGDPDEWEKGEWWEYVLSALYGPAASLPGVGEALEALGTLVFFTLPGHVFDIEALKKAKTRASVGRALIDVGGTWRAMQKLYEFMTDDKEHTLAEYTRAASTVSRTLAIGTGWMGNMVGYWSTALAVLTNPVDFVARVWRNMKHYYEE